MPRKFVHICGPSCSGKKTLAKRLLDGDPLDLRPRFGIDGAFQIYGDFGDKRSKPAWKFPWAIEDIVVHWWQFNSHGWIAHHLKASPGVPQLVYLLWRPWALQAAAAEGRGWNLTAEASRDHWHSQIAPMFRQIEGWGIEVELVDARDGYKKTSFEEIERAAL